MFTLQSLRNATLLARLVLVGWALVTGVAIASPLVKPDSLALVCSGTGVMQLLSSSDDGGEAASRHTLDCPLCLVLIVPPPMARAGLAPSPADTLVLPTDLAPCRPSLGAVPPPARAPPALS